MKSGVCLRGAEGTLSHWTTDLRTPADTRDFILRLTAEWAGAHVIIEDIPARMANNLVLKNAYRMQGRILEAIDRRPPGHHPLTVSWYKPDTWQRHFGVFGEGKNEAVFKADQLGMQMPQGRLSQKTLQDLADAYLIALYAEHCLETYGTLDTRWALEFTDYRGSASG